MRMGRARLTEWVEDILKYGDENTPEGWADCIMDDINRGIIAREPSTYNHQLRYYDAQGKLVSTSEGVRLNDDLDDIVYRGTVPTEGLTVEEEL